MIATLPEHYVDLLPEVADFLAAPLNLYINGEFIPAQSGETFTTLDPSTGRELAQVARGARADVDVAVKAARAA
ncbi:MAG: betaine-aldehyde dehydrogenase, partial [Chloroflexota bacterium]